MVLLFLINNRWSQFLLLSNPTRMLEFDCFLGFLILFWVVPIDYYSNFSNPWGGMVMEDEIESCHERWHEQILQWTNTKQRRDFFNVFRILLEFLKHFKTSWKFSKSFLKFIKYFCQFSFFFSYFICFPLILFYFI